MAPKKSDTDSNAGAVVLVKFIQTATDFRPDLTALGAELGLSGGSKNIPRKINTVLNPLGYKWADGKIQEYSNGDLNDNKDATPKPTKPAKLAPAKKGPAKKATTKGKQATTSDGEGEGEDAEDATLETPAAKKAPPKKRSTKSMNEMTSDGEVEKDDTSKAALVRGRAKKGEPAAKKQKVRSPSTGEDELVKLKDNGDGAEEVGKEQSSEVNMSDDV